MTASIISASYVPDNLIAGDSDDLLGRSETLISGQNLLRGAVLGKITSGGKYTLSLSAATNGSQTPDVILAEDCDASGGDKTCLVYWRGDFNQQALILGASHTAASIREGLRGKGIFIVDTIQA